MAKRLVVTDVELLLERMHGLLKYVVDFESPLTTGARFRGEREHDLSQEKCDAYAMVTDAQLSNSFKKDELIALGENVLAIPKTMDDANKADWCKVISKHYNRMLTLIRLVNAVHDTHNNGAESLAGIVFRNLYIRNNVIEIFFCAVPQDSQGNSVVGAAAKEIVHPHAKGQSLTAQDVFVDFKNLKGVRLLVESVLTSKEAQIFLQELQFVLHQSSGPEFRRVVCNDELVDRDALFPGVECKDMWGHLAEKPVEYMLTVPSNNPVLDNRYCQMVRKVVVPISAVHVQYKNLRRNYHNNIAKVFDIVEKDLIERPTAESYRVRNLTAGQLDAIERKLKSAVVTFYLQTVVDYHALLNRALNEDHVLA